MSQKLVKLKGKLMIMIIIISIRRSENFTAKLKQVNLATKPGIDDFLWKTDIDDKIKNLNKTFTSNKTKHIEDEKEITDLIIKVAQIYVKQNVFYS